MIIKRKNSSYSLIPVLLFLLAGPLSCMATKHGSKTETSESQILTNPQIIYLNYSVISDKSKGVTAIRLINKTITEGRLKKNLNRIEIPKPGDMFCFALNSNMEPVDSLIIPDPLNITVESVDEKNALFRKEMALDSAQFTIRMQLDEKIWAVGIRTRLNPEKSSNFMLITKIKQP
jgi:hypothetical protein